MNHFYSIRIITFAKKPFTNNFHNPVNQKPLCSIFKNNYIILSINLYFFTATTSPERIDGSMLSPYTRMLICLLGDPSIFFLVNVQYSCQQIYTMLLKCSFEYFFQKSTFKHYNSIKSYKFHLPSHPLRTIHWLFMISLYNNIPTMSIYIEYLFTKLPITPFTSKSHNSLW